jgi:DNA repair protein RecO (recombination protein O)
MQYIRDRAFVLRRVNFGDSHRYITLFSQNNGKIEVVAKGVRKITSRRAASLEPLNLIEFQSVKSIKNSILTEVKLISSFNDLKKELSNIEKVFTICEIIDSIMPYGQKHKDVFELILSALEKIPSEPRTVTYFQAKLLSMLGFWDRATSFKNAGHVKYMVEQVIERKLKTEVVFKI